MDWRTNKLLLKPWHLAAAETCTGRHDSIAFVTEPLHNPFHRTITVILLDCLGEVPARSKRQQAQLRSSFPLGRCQRCEFRSMHYKETLDHFQCAQL